MALSGNFSTNAYDGRYYSFEWTATQNIAGNYSDISWTLKCMGGNQNWYAERDLVLTIDGGTVYSKTDSVERYAGTITSGTAKLSHDANGSRSFSVAIKAAVQEAYVNVTGSNTFTLDQIPRKAIITDAPNFTALSSPTITYSNPMGDAATTLQACISLTGENDDIPYRDIPKTGTSYTFELTADEITTLKTAVTKGTTITVRFNVRTALGDSFNISYLQKTFSLTEEDYPTLSPVIYDTNETSTDVTKDNTIIVKGISYAHYKANAQASEGATIKNITVDCDDDTGYGEEGTLDYPKSDTFIFTVIDSRDNSTTQTVKVPFVDYFEQICKDINYDLSANGVLSIHATGEFYSGNIGAGKLSPVIWVYIKDGNSVEHYTLYSSNPEHAKYFTINGNSLTFDYEISGLDYNKPYILDCVFSFQPGFGSYGWGRQYVYTKPLFDWGQYSFNFNVPISMPNMNGIYSVDKDGNEVEALMPCDANNNLRLGSGGFDSYTGSTDIYGNNITMYSRNPVVVYNSLQLNGVLKLHGATILRGNDDTTNTVLSANNGNIYIRPKGTDSTSGQVILNNDGNLEISGNLSLSEDTVLKVNNYYHNTTLCANGGAVYIRPNGVDDTSGQVYIQSDGNVNIDGAAAKGTIGQQKTLHNDSGRFMLATQSIELTGDARITKQINGYIIVWLYYLNGKPFAGNINYTFIPKAVTGFYDGLITVPLVQDNSGIVASKTLQIMDDGATTTIYGNGYNDDSPNNKWVLKHIIGC